MGDPIPDMIREAVVEVGQKGAFSISSDLQSNPIELNDILCNSLTVHYSSACLTLLQQT